MKRNSQHSQTVTLELPLPHNLDAERAVLGAVLLDNHQLDAALEHLKPEDFFLDQHRRIFERMIDLQQAQKAIDSVMLMEELEHHGELEASGGAAYMGSLLDGVPRVTNVEHYAKLVKDKSLLRNLAHAGHNIQQSALMADEDAEEILARAESVIFQLAEERIRRGPQGVKDVVRDNFTRLEKIFSEGRRVTGLPTGYNQLDNLTAGLQDAEFIILAARPSMGKTALALNLAENIAVRQRNAVAIFSLEMSKDALLLRLLASHARIDAHKFRTGHLGKEDWRRITESLGELAEAPLWLDDEASQTVLEIGAKARRLKREHGLSMVIIDYLQLVSVRGKFSNRTEAVTELSRSLKLLARELKVPILVLSQLSRAPDKQDRRPQLADLRDSGALEQDADTVMFIHRPNFFKVSKTEEERGQTELIVAKQRNGPTDKIDFVFLSTWTRFEERTPEAWEPTDDLAD